jgi:hypothetical protein
VVTPGRLHENPARPTGAPDVREQHRVDARDLDVVVPPHHVVALARDVGGSKRSDAHDALGGGNSMPLTAATLSRTGYADHCDLWGRSR